MDHSLRSWLQVTVILGATFGLMAMSVADDIRRVGEPHRVEAFASVSTPPPYIRVLPTVDVRPTAEDFAVMNAVIAAEQAALAEMLVPVSIREAQLQIENARIATRRVSRVSLRLPYYAFGPDPIRRSK